MVQNNPILNLSDPCAVCKMSDNGWCKSLAMVLENAVKVCKLKDMLGSKCIHDLAHGCRVTGKKCTGTCKDDTRSKKKMSCECGLNSWRKVDNAGGGYGVYACAGCGKTQHIKEETTISKLAKQKPKNVDVPGQISLASFGKHIDEDEDD